MVFSPRREIGGTLHFPSPTNKFSLDTSSAIEQLRHSLSRSPSPVKVATIHSPPAFHLVSGRTDSPSTMSSTNHSILLSPTKQHAENIFAAVDADPQAPKTPFPTLRAGRPILRRTHGMHFKHRRTSPRASSRTSPHRSASRGPSKRVLSDLSDHGNATNYPLTSSKTGENDISTTPKGEPFFDARSAALFSLDQSTNSHVHALSKRSSYGRHLSSSNGSPLKRSDGVMNLSQAGIHSPNPKRRSLRGTAAISTTPDFNIFDSDAEQTLQFDGTNESDVLDTEMTPAPTSNLKLFAPKSDRSTATKGASKQVGGKSVSSISDIHDFAVKTPTRNHRSRMSWSSTTPSENPFSTTPMGAPPSPSKLLLQTPCLQTGKAKTLFDAPPDAYPHPLSRNIAQSSSGSSVATESPTQSTHRHAFNSGKIDFSKSLPVGATRPHLADEGRDGSKPAERSFDTPNYKLAKPLPAAFMSTGLISKKKNVEDQIASDDLPGIMPETPCKKTNPHAFALPPSFKLPPPGSAMKKSRSRNFFGGPVTPFNPRFAVERPPKFGKDMSIFAGRFHSNKKGVAKHNSCLNNEDKMEFSRSIDREAASIFDSPSTPTKSSLRNVFQTSPVHYHDVATQVNISAHETDKQSDVNALHKSDVLFRTSTESLEADSDATSMVDSPSGPKFKSLCNKTPSALSVHGTPPFGAQNLTPPLVKHPERVRTKTASPATPVIERFRAESPHTPKNESVLFPDANSFSIPSATKESRLAKSCMPLGVPPTTPRAPRDYFSSLFGKHSTGGARSTFDNTFHEDSLNLRFDKVELIGHGEFSDVYKVIKTTESPNKTSPHTPLADQVWAVKKAKNRYAGPRDRNAKLQEVRILKALGHSDHIVQLFDHWEEDGRLYIQTEYCEDGTLDRFLAKVGAKGRLDDFRIWKILLEMSLGLKHIHDCNFIHLDLKPANVLVSFEGVLKIGDFGMATSWPAAPGIDGEGDREYIAPETLRGQFDKPADVFALGLIMLEIAGNVQLPENGTSWQKLRAGDMSDVPSLTWSSVVSGIVRDSQGNPIPESVENDGNDETYGSASDLGDDEFTSPSCVQQAYKQKSTPKRNDRKGELIEPPQFMTNPCDLDALDQIVRWMISPQPMDRPVIDEVLESQGVKWADRRRRAGATIYEGNWGPADDVVGVDMIGDDAEMLDV